MLIGLAFRGARTGTVVASPLLMGRSIPCRVVDCVCVLGKGVCISLLTLTGLDMDVC